MAYYIPKRSVGGCLTCKQRKKKCDETKPTCQRCNKGNFPCLGYSMPDDPGGQCQGIWHEHKERASPTQDPADDPTPTRPGDLVPLSTQAISALDISQGRDIRAVAAPLLVNLPQGIVLGTDSTATREMASFVLNHYRARVQSILFKLPPSIPIERGLQRRMLVSKTARWSLYLGARIAEDLSQGNNGQRYMSWVTCLYRHIMENSNSEGFEDKSLELRMASLRELTTWVFVVLGTSAGYLLFKSSATLFFQLSALSPETWTADGAVSIQGAMQTRHFEIRNYVLQDTIMAMALGVPSIISYDVSLSWSEEASRQYLAWIYGIPAGLIILLANINSWRASRFVGHPNPNHDWRRIEKHLQGWSPDVDHSQEASDYIVRLAVQECWRQAALIYLYMGMCEVDSGDSRVKSGVRQVAQLASTIGKNSSLMPHLFVPCLVAGAAARQERHRAVIRAKIMACHDLLPLTLRGGDFLPVLDHLWRGAASEGRPILWQDYVQSRRATLPLVP